jgi:hypothetical protein
MGKDGQSQNIEKKGDDDAVSRIWRKGQKEKKKKLIELASVRSQ